MVTLPPAARLAVCLPGLRAAAAPLVAHGAPALAAVGRELAVWLRIARWAVRVALWAA